MWSPTDFEALCVSVEYQESQPRNESSQRYAEALDCFHRDDMKHGSSAKVNTSKAQPKYRYDPRVARHLTGHSRTVANFTQHAGVKLLAA
jgi:hypothetical protein